MAHHLKPCPILPQENQCSEASEVCGQQVTLADCKAWAFMLISSAILKLEMWAQEWCKLSRHERKRCEFIYKFKNSFRIYIYIWIHLHEYEFIYKFIYKKLRINKIFLGAPKIMFFFHEFIKIWIHMWFLVLVGIDRMQLVTSLNPTLTAGCVCKLMVPLWCDLGCCSLTIVIAKLLQTSAFEFWYEFFDRTLLGISEFIVFVKPCQISWLFAFSWERSYWKSCL